MGTICFVLFIIAALAAFIGHGNGNSVKEKVRHTLYGIAILCLFFIFIILGSSL